MKTVDVTPIVQATGSVQIVHVTMINGHVAASNDPYLNAGFQIEPSDSPASPPAIAGWNRAASNASAPMNAACNAALNPGKCSGKDRPRGVYNVA